MSASMTSTSTMISITLGKFKSQPITVNLSNGGHNDTTPVQVATNQPSSVKVSINPDDPREVGIVALAPTTGAEVHMSVAGFDVFIVVSVPTPTITGITLGTPGAETDPPAWALA